MGSLLEEHLRNSADVLEQYYLEAMADLALNQLHRDLGRRLESRFGFSQLSAMSPGSLSSWPIDQQRQLFDLLGDTEVAVGVRLTDSCLMVPRKSISGIFFPTERKFFSCQLCPRVQCVGRKAPYDPESVREMDSSAIR
jgi:hypothetical protein